MAGRGGTRRGSRLGAADALSIFLVIVLLGCSLGALVASRDPRFVARTQEWVRVVMNHLSPGLLLPNQASAEAAPSTPRTTTP